MPKYEQTHLQNSFADIQEKYAIFNLNANDNVLALNKNETNLPSNPLYSNLETVSFENSNFLQKPDCLLLENSNKDINFTIKLEFSENMQSDTAIFKKIFEKLVKNLFEPAALNHNNPIETMQDFYRKFANDQKSKLIGSINIFQNEFLQEEKLNICTSDVIKDISVPQNYHLGLLKKKQDHEKLKIETCSKICSNKNLSNDPNKQYDPKLSFFPTNFEFERFKINEINKKSKNGLLKRKGDDKGKLFYIKKPKLDSNEAFSLIKDSAKSENLSPKNHTKAENINQDNDIDNDEKGLCYFEKINRKKKTSKISCLLNHLETKEYFQLANDDQILENFKASDKFNSTSFINFLKEKLIKSNVLIQEYSEDKSMHIDYKFYNYQYYQKEIKSYLGDKNNFKYYNLSKEFKLHELINFFDNIRCKFVNNKQKLNLINIEIKAFSNYLGKIDNPKSFSFKNLQVKIKLIDKKILKLAIQDLKIMKNIIFEIIKRNREILINIFPDIIDSIDIEEIFVENYTLSLTNRDLYDYLIVLFIFEKLISLDKKILFESNNSNQIMFKKSDKTYYKLDIILIIRFHFLRLVFPFIKINVFLNYAEIYFSFIYLRLGVKNESRKKLPIKYHSLKNKILLVSLLFFRLQRTCKKTKKKQKIPNYLFMCYALCYSANCEVEKNNKRAFISFFDPNFLFDIIDDLIKKFVPISSVNYSKWKKINDIKHSKELKHESVFAKKIRVYSITGINILEELFVLI
ncbi:hypothetical protein GVAV_002281 [Gurleya vavrai]